PGAEAGGSPSPGPSPPAGASSPPRVVLPVPHGRSALGPAGGGAMAYVRAAVSRALAAPAGSELKLRVILNRRGAQRYLATVAKRFDHAPVDSLLALRNLRPLVTKEQAGRTLRQ